MLLRCCRRDNERSRPVSIHVARRREVACGRSSRSRGELTHHRCVEVPKCPAAAGMPRPGRSPALATCPIRDHARDGHAAERVPADHPLTLSRALDIGDHRIDTDTFRCRHRRAPITNIPPRRQRRMSSHNLSQLPEAIFSRSLSLISAPSRNRRLPPSGTMT